jgi:hypothetical protein
VFVGGLGLPNPPKVDDWLFWPKPVPLPNPNDMVGDVDVDGDYCLVWRCAEVGSGKKARWHSRLARRKPSRSRVLLELEKRRENAIKVGNACRLRNRCLRWTAPRSFPFKKDGGRDEGEVGSSRKLTGNDWRPGPF